MDKSEYTLGDYNKWFERCKYCGYDPGRSDDNRCWKCGRTLSRDFSERALKPGKKIETKPITEPEDLCCPVCLKLLPDNKKSCKHCGWDYLAPLPKCPKCKSHKVEYQTPKFRRCLICNNIWDITTPIINNNLPYVIIVDDISVPLAITQFDIESHKKWLNKIFSMKKLPNEQ